MNLVSIGVFVMMGAGTSECDHPPAGQLVVSPRVLVIAHRGASADAPENTLPAFRLAIEAKADLVELDYYHSADNVPVVFHDGDLDRTTDARQVIGGAKVPVQDVTIQQLKRLDAGKWFSPKYAGTRIPTLEEALAVIQSGSTTLIERKHGDAATCVRLVDKQQALSRVVIQAFDWDFLTDLHALEPRATLAALGDKELTEEKLNDIRRTGAAVVGWNHKHIERKQIEMVHGRGWKLWVYTVDDPEIARRLIADGVDGLITDRPAEMRNLVDSVPRNGPGK